jgi:ABC-type transport system involved in multi-copper enzyme maturation permease subunit
MTALLQSQLLQLRTLRSSYVVAGVMVLFVALIAGFVSADAGAADLDTAKQLREPLAAGAGIMVAVVVAVLSAGRVSGEYRHGTIVQRVLAAPSRRSMVVSALVVHAAYAAAVAAVAFAVGVVIAAAVLAPTAYTNGLTGGALATTAGAVVLAGASFGAMGAALGFIARSQVAAVVTVFAVFFAEKLLAPLLGAGAGYLPYSLLNSLLELDGPLGVPAAAIALTVFTLGTAGAAVVLTGRRDVD